MSDVTRILTAIEHGDPHAAKQLLPLVYEELRTLAAQRLAGETRRRPWSTRRTFDWWGTPRIRPENSVSTGNSRGHFFAAAAEAMRRILINRARDKGRLKRAAVASASTLTNLTIRQARPTTTCST